MSESSDLYNLIAYERDLRLDGTTVRYSHENIPAEKFFFYRQYYRDHGLRVRWSISAFGDGVYGN